MKLSLKISVFPGSMQRNLDSVIRVSVLLIEMTLHQRSVILNVILDVIVNVMSVMKPNDGHDRCCCSVARYEAIV